MSGSDDIRPAGPGMKLTYDDYLLFPEDGKRHELIDGEHYVTPSPNRKHQAIAWNLTVMIGSWLKRNPIGRAFAAPFDVVFSRFDVVEPDLLYIAGARQDDVLTAAHVRGAPDLVVEIGSPGTRKRDEDDQAQAVRAVRRCGVLGDRSGARYNQSLSTFR
ncbi:MAG TPA: Uma2 family endonuclease [Vicinamibacterales bacterium]|nr:Uma2 family endonuclease [Vicinamibacterales bacterium]